MKILLPASEVAPIIKFGGLGDVIGSLPKALEKLGINVDVAIPYYPTVKIEDIKTYKSMDLQVPFDSATHTIEVFKTKLPGSNVDVLLFKNAKYFARGGKSAFADNISETEMFAFFNRCVVEYIKAEFNTYDLVHCNDWHTGLITHILADEVGSTRPATLFTIHNLGYQGVGDAELVKEIGFVPGEHPLIDWDIKDGDLNMLQQGITSSDFINAVSPQYAKEVLTKEFGGKLHEVLIAREARIIGILNGINYDDFPRDFDETNWKTTKLKSKVELANELGYEDFDETKPMFSFIGRLDGYQKGLDVLHKAIPNIVKDGGYFTLLGTGDAEWEDVLKKIASDKSVSKFLSINIIFDVDLALKIYKASDFLVVPSRYEPCGLIQMMAMHYGTLPVVHGVGGLFDSVEDSKDGIVYEKHTVTDLRKALKRAFSLYYGEEYPKMVKAAMTKDFSWDKSAIEYKNLYERVISLRKEQTNEQIYI